MPTDLQTVLNQLRSAGKEQAKWEATFLRSDAAREAPQWARQEAKNRRAKRYAEVKDAAAAALAELTTERSRLADFQLDRNPGFARRVAEARRTGSPGARLDRVSTTTLLTRAADSTDLGELADIVTELEFRAQDEGKAAARGQAERVEKRLRELVAADPAVKAAATRYHALTYYDETIPRALQSLETGERDKSLTWEPLAVASALKADGVAVAVDVNPDGEVTLSVAEPPTDTFTPAP
jgi:hypothetical protein